MAAPGVGRALWGWAGRAAGPSDPCIGRPPALEEGEGGRVGQLQVFWQAARADNTVGVGDRG